MNGFGLIPLYHKQWFLYLFYWQRGMCLSRINVYARLRSMSNFYFSFMWPGYIMQLEKVLQVEKEVGGHPRYYKSIDSSIDSNNITNSHIMMDEVFIIELLCHLIIDRRSS